MNVLRKLSSLIHLFTDWLWSTTPIEDLEIDQAVRLSLIPTGFKPSRLPVTTKKGGVLDDANGS